MDLEKIVVTFVANASQYNRVVDHVEYRLLRLTRMVGTLGPSFNLPFIAAAGAMGSFAYAASSAALEGLRLANSYQQAAIAFEVMTGSATTGKKLLDEITQLAVETPFKSAELIAGAQTLKAFGTETEQVVPIMRMLGDVAAGVGIEKFDRIVLAFGQARVAGRLMGQELRQFINAGVPLIEALAKVMNQPVQSITGLIEQGRVGIPDMIKAFRYLTDNGGMFFKMMERQSETVAGRWSALVETVQIGLRNLGIAFFDEFKIAENLDNLVKRLSIDNQDFSKPFKDIKEVLAWIERTIQFTAHWINEAYKATGKWADENQAVLDHIGHILKVILGVIIAVKVIMFVASGIAAVWAIISATIALATSPLGLFVIGITAVVLALEELGAFDNVGEALAQSFQKAGEVFKEVAQGIKDAMTANDFDLAGKIIGKSIEYYWKLALATIRTEWDQFIDNMGTTVTFRLARESVKFESWVERNLHPFAGQERLAQMEAWRNKQLETIDREEAASKAPMRDAYEARLRELKTAADPVLAELRTLIGRAKEEAALAKYTASLAEITKNKDYIEAEKVVRAEFDRQNQAMQAVGGFGVVGTMMEGKFDKTGFPGGGFWLEDWILNTRLPGHWDPSKVSKERLETFKKTDEVFKAYQKMAEIGAKAGITAWAGGAPLQWLGIKEAEDRKIAERAAIPLALDPRAVEIANRIRKEMTQGVWGGQRYDSYNRFQQNLGLLDQGYYGLGGKEGLFGFLFGKPGGIGSVLNKDQYEFGIFEEYTNLKKLIGAGAQVNYPRALYRGSTEAQDAINRAQYEQKSVQEEVRDTLRQALEVQQQQRDYARQVVSEIQALRGEVSGRKVGVPLPWDGGDF